MLNTVKFVTSSLSYLQLQQTFRLCTYLVLISILIFWTIVSIRIFPLQFWFSLYKWYQLGSIVTLQSD